MKRRWFKFTRRVDFCLIFEYRNPVLSRETSICRFWLRTSAQENPYKYLWATKTTSKWYFESVSAKTGVSESMPGMSGNNVRSIQTYTQSIRVPFHQRQISESLSGISGDNIWSIWTYTWSIRVPFRQWLVFVSEGINTSPPSRLIPLQPALSCPFFKLNSLTRLSRALSLPLFLS
jgi:hypothetical protein